MPLTDPNRPINFADLDPNQFADGGEHVVIRMDAAQFTAAFGIAPDQIATNDQNQIVFNGGGEAGPDQHVTAGGFQVDAQEPTRGIITLTLADQTQVPFGLDNIITVPALEARSTPMRSAFDRPLGGYQSVQ